MFKANQKAYLLASVFLGILVTTIVHALLEMWYIQLLVTDFDTWSFGLTWDIWYSIHSVLTVLLLLLGIVGGLVVGKRWWRSVYEKRKKGLFFKIK